MAERREGVGGAPALGRVLDALERLAPLGLAESWDVVGLLAEPSAARPVRRILLTIDLTADVAEEAVARGADLVVAYHPPTFEGPKRLLGSDWRTAPVVRLIEERIALYSPHTALDAAAGGVCDWLADALGPGRRRPLQVGGRDVSLLEGPVPREGQGREVVLRRGAPLDAIVARLKRHLGLARLRVARSPFHGGPDAPPIRQVALVAGAGGQILRTVGADLYVTGEMRHHDVAAACARGTSVVLAEHTHTERGYLPILGDRLSRALGGRVEVIVARTGREPIQIL